MSVSPVNPQLSIYQSNSANSPKNYLQQLQQSLNSGNIPSAQQAYSNIQSLYSNSQGANPFTSDLNALGQALQSGNVSAAQQALQSLKQHLKAHHHGGQTPASAVWGSSSQPLSAGQDSDGDADGSGSVSAGFSVSA